MDYKSQVRHVNGDSKQRRVITDDNLITDHGAPYDKMYTRGDAVRTTNER